MKVLAEGTWKNPWSGEFVCPTKSCGAKLLVEEADVKARDYSTGYVYKCPICGKDNLVPTDDLPQRIKEVLDRVRKVSSGDWRD